MNPSDLEKLARKLPISEATRRRNQTGGVPSGPKPQQAIRHEPLGSKQVKVEHPKRCKISVVSYRKKLLDPDNLCPKFFIDSLRYEGLIADDTAAHVVIEVRQEKVKDDPRTEITITPL